MRSCEFHSFFLPGIEKNLKRIIVVTETVEVFGNYLKLLEIILLVLVGRRSSFEMLAKKSQNLLESFFVILLFSESFSSAIAI
ncbi:hypothetical protein L1887_30529 [Cichorium endivia]|nr:hypothetical protein L1887_30529 [Cichorium endivia]